MKIFYSAGPGNVIKSYKSWIKHEEYEDEVARTYSEQFFNICKNHNFLGKLEAHSQTKEQYKDSFIDISHLDYFRKGKSLIFHLREILFTLGQIFRVLKSGSSYAVVSDNIHWWLWSIPALFGVKIIPSIHCVFWTKGNKPHKGLSLILLNLNIWFWRRFVYKTITISKECSRQIEEMTNDRTTEVYESFPKYNIRNFFDIELPEVLDTFFIMYAGRVEEEKGVFFIVDVAAKLKELYGMRIQWEIYGSGSASGALEKAIESSKLCDVISIKGHKNSIDMKNAYKKANIIFVPTTAKFHEGLNKVAIEGALSCRPVIGSKYVPAADIIGNSYVCVEPDTVNNYVKSIIKLILEKEYYFTCCSAGLLVRDLLISRSMTWEESLESALGFNKVISTAI